MKSLKNLIQQKNSKTQTSLDKKTVFYVFSKIIQEELGNIGSEKLKPDYFRNKTLFIKSSSSAWKSELWMNRERIVKKINAALSSDAVDKIKV